MVRTGEWGPGARVDYVTAVPLVRKQRLSVSRRIPWLGEWVLGEAEVEEGLDRHLPKREGGVRKEGLYPTQCPRQSLESRPPR